MGYEVDLNILESYARILLDAPREPTEKIFGIAATIESDVSMMKERKKREKLMKDASKFVADVKKGLMGFEQMSGIAESMKESKTGQQLVAHVSPVVTSSERESDKAVEFKRVERKKRKPSLTPTPSPKGTRTLRNKQQAMREPNIQRKKLTPKKPTPKVLDILSLEELINEITQDGNLSNINKYYHTFKDSDKGTIEESIIRHLDIYKKVLIEVIDDLPDDLYLRLEAKRMFIMELDKN